MTIALDVQGPEAEGDQDDDQLTDAAAKNSQDPPGIHLMCYVCGQVLHDVVLFSNHLIAQHITATPHRCGMCGFSSAKRALLATHVLTVHEQELPANPRYVYMEIDEFAKMCIIMSHRTLCELCGILSFKEVIELTNPLSSHHS